MVAGIPSLMAVLLNVTLMGRIRVVVIGVEERVVTLSTVLVLNV